MSSLLIERLNIVEAAVPTDLGTAITGDYVNLKEWGRVLIICHSGVGTAAQDPTFSFFQAQDVAGTGAKDLNPIDGQVFKKQAATNLAAVGQWSDGFAEVSANDYVGDGTSAEQDLIVAVEFSVDDLDTDNGFDCVRVDSADVGAAAQLGQLTYILGDPRHTKEPTSQLTAIA